MHTTDIASNGHISREYLRAHPDTIFVFGDNLLRIGKKGAAILRDEPNSYGFVTKKEPSYKDSAYYRPDEYKSVFSDEVQKLTAFIEANPGKKFLVTPLGSGLANRYGIYEAIIRQALAEIAAKYPNTILLGETRDLKEETHGN